MKTIFVLVLFRLYGVNPLLKATLELREMIQNKGDGCTVFPLAEVSVAAPFLSIQLDTSLADLCGALWCKVEAMNLLSLAHFFLFLADWDITSCFGSNIRKTS